LFYLAVKIIILNFLKLKIKRIVNKLRIKKNVFVNAKILQLVYAIDAMNYYVINVVEKENI